MKQKNKDRFLDAVLVLGCIALGGLGSAALSAHVLTGLTVKNFESFETALEAQSTEIDSRLSEMENRIYAAELVQDFRNKSFTGTYYAEGFFFVQTEREADVVLGTTLHEYGHYVYAELLEPAQWKEWTTIHEAEHNLSITEYARTNPREDFAESFEAASTCNATTCSIDTSMLSPQRAFFFEEQITEVFI